jgi:hypothetical protein
MKFLLVNTKTFEQTVVDYPRQDKEPIIGMEKEFELYAIDENKPEYDPLVSDIIHIGVELTEKEDSEYPCKIALKKWEQVEHVPSEQTENEKLKSRIDELETMIKGLVTK